MNVTVREKKLSKGFKSLYLDYYPPIISPETRKPTRRQFLSLRIYEKPKGILQRDHNKETRAIAEQVCAKRYLEIQAGQYEFLRKSTQKESFLAYFKGLAEKRKTSKGNYDNWLSSYNYFNAFSRGHCDMENITESLCNDFREYLLTTPSVKSKNTVKTLSQNAAHSYFNKFRAAVNQAFQDRLIPRNPIRNVKGVKPAETHREFLTLDELNKLAKVECDPPILRSMALFSALTGLRWSDITSISWGQILPRDSDGYYIQFKQKKTKGAETLPISQQAIDLLGPRGNQHELIFKDIEYSGVLNSKLKAWVARAGIQKNITFHCFRHTYATLQLANGTDIYTVSKMLGHRNLKTTQIYANIMDQKKIEASDKIKIDI